MRREIRYGLAALRRRPLIGLVVWSVPEALPAAVMGFAIARAVDDGFLARRPLVGLAWLGLIVVASTVGGLGSRQVFRRLGELVEPVRDDLVRKVVRGALRRGAAGERDDGAVARLTRQVEIVRDTFAGIIVVLRGFAVTVTGVVIGLWSISPAIAGLILPPFLVGFLAFLATLGMAAARQRAAVLADERLAAVAGQVLSGTRDVVACGGERRAGDLVAGPIRDQAAAERALAIPAAARTLCFAVGGWLPLVLVLAAGPWLVRQGLTAGAIMGGLTYVLAGLQPALRSLIAGLGGSGLRFVVTLRRILDATDVADPPTGSGALAPGGPNRSPSGLTVACRGVTFAYGPHAEPVLRELDLSVPAGEHLAVVGPSGVGKSTLAGLVAGLRRPDAGAVFLGGVPAPDVPPPFRVLVPQEAYVFTDTVRENLAYLRPSANDRSIAAAAAAVGADELIDRLGGLAAQLDPAGLSAGERQLIALTRAYLSAAPLVILDEATCHLDPAAERRAEEAFAARPGTLIVIAHRISSALRAHRVLVLDGVAAAIGEPATLADTSPLYRELLGNWGVAEVVPAAVLP